MELVVLVSHFTDASLRCLIISTYSNDFSTLMTCTSIYTSAVNEQFAFSWQPNIHLPAVHTKKNVYKNRHVIGFIYSIYSVSCKTHIQTCRLQNQLDEENYKTIIIVDHNSPGSRDILRVLSLYSVIMIFNIQVELLKTNRRILTSAFVLVCFQTDQQIDQ